MTSFNTSKKYNNIMKSKNFLGSRVIRGFQISSNHTKILCNTKEKLLTVVSILEKVLRTRRTKRYSSVKMKSQIEFKYISTLLVVKNHPSIIILYYLTTLQKDLEIKATKNLKNNLILIF